MDVEQRVRELIEDAVDVHVAPPQHSDPSIDAMLPFALLHAAE